MATKITSDNISQTTLTLLGSLGSAVPKVSTITYPGNDTAADTAGGQTITLTGSGFNSGASVIINGSYAGVVTFVSNTSITFTAPANSGGTYPLYVVNTDGSTAISVPGISYSGTPSWSTAAGSIATLYETAALSNTVTATGDATISYSLYSGTLPPGSSLNTSTGLISGTSQGVASTTTYTFTIRVTDGQNQDTDRTFSITLNPDSVTWSSPTDNSTVTGYEYTAISPVTLDATSAAGKSITYTANSLPTGLSISGATIIGTPSVVANTNSLLTANAASTFKTQTRNINFVVNQDVVTWNSPADGTTTALSQSTAMSNVTLSATSAAGQSIAYTANALPTGVTISGSNVTGTPTVLGNTISVITATAANTNRTATRTFTWVVSVANDTYFKYTSLLLNGETTVTPFIKDASANNFALTIAGDTKPVLFNPYQGDGYYSNYFDGTGDYLAINHASGSTIAGDFTWETWAYDTGATTNGTLLGWRTGSWTGFIIQRNNSANVVVAINNGSNITQTSGTYLTNAWNHVAVVRSGTTVTLYVNGTSAGTVTVSGSFNPGTSYWIGSDPLNNVSAVQLQGYISNQRFVNGTAVYTSNFTPSTTPLTAITNTSLLTCQSNRLIDKSTNAFVITRNGDVSVSPNIPFTANSSYSTYGSTYFDGSDSLSMAGNAAYAFGTGDFTVEFWLYMNVDWTSLANQGIAGQLNSVSAGWQIYRNTGSNDMMLRLVNTSDYGAGTYPATKVWEHWAVTRSGTTLRWFKNGVVTSTATGVSNNVTDTSAIFYIGYTQTWGGYLDGTISDLRIVKGTAVYTTAFTPPTSPLTAITNTSLLTLQYNGGATNKGVIDNSNFNNIITRNGNTSQGTFSPYSVTGWSNYFNGSAGYINSASSTNNALGSGDYTIEFWCYSNSLGGSSAGSMFYADMSGYQQLLRHNGSVWECYYKSGVGFTNVSTTTVGINQWVHHALVRSSGVVKWFINGVLYGSAADTTNFNTATLFQIGNYSGYIYNGYVSNVRVVKGTAVYTTASTTIGATIFTPPTEPLTPITGTIFLTGQSNRIVDNGPLNQTITISGTPSVQAFSPFGSIPEAIPLSYSNYFDGTGDYLTVPNINFASNPYTIEGWFYITAASVPSNVNFWGMNNGSGNNPKMILVADGTQFQLLCGNGSAADIIVNHGGLAVNTWHHIAVVRTGTSANQHKIYLNGIALNSTSTAFGSTSVISATFNIGYVGEGFGSVFPGYISNFRIVNGTAVYTTTFTPSTTPLTAIANTSLLTCQSTRMIDNSTNAFTITATGDVKPRIFNPFGYTAQSATSYTPSTHGGSIYFDGTGDYLNLPTNTLFGFGNGDFTIEFWAYPTVNARQDWIDITDGANRVLVYYSGSAITFYSVPSPAAAITGPAMVLNAWQHIALSKSSGSSKLFVNGVQVGSTYASNHNYFTTSPVSIGKDSAGSTHVTGYMSDIRIIKGTAIYTSNFVPPTQTLTNYSTNIPAQLLLNFNNGGIIDQHGSNVLETVGNAQLSTAVKKYGNTSMYFDGTADRLITSPGVINSLGSGDFTIEGWVYPLSLGSMRILSQGTYAAGEFLFILNSNGSADFCEATTSRVTFSAGSFVVGEWKHFAIVRSGSGSNNLKGYINGTLAGTGTSSSYNYSATTAIFVGSNPTTSSQDFQGYIDDLRITKGVARYTTTFTPPTESFITK